VGAYHEEHHATGNRLRQSFMEDVRGELFCSWIGKGKTVLDLGGRDGSLTRHLLDGNRVVIGDIDIAALAYARGNYTVDTVQINLNEPLPFVSESCDVVVMAEVLEHLPYPKITLSEVERVLHKGGGLIGSIPLAYHLKDRWQVLRGATAEKEWTHLRRKVDPSGSCMI